MSKVVSLYHIVFSTHERRATITHHNRERMYRYAKGIARKMRCKILEMNGMPDHVHILASLHSTVALATLVGRIKQRTSLYMHHNILFPHFHKWEKEYFATSLSPSALPNVRNYIKNQEQHHGIRNFEDEINWMVESIGMECFEDEELEDTDDEFVEDEE
ncbi:MAG: IS200/IS605 family transposase [Bacteroidales bacterium]|nr:IS200/IS605 family transposase [Bacteroidales bacterium]